MTNFKKEVDREAVEDFCKEYRQGISISQENGECIARRAFISFDGVVTTVGGVSTSEEIDIRDPYPMKAIDWAELLKLLLHENEYLPKEIEEIECNWLKGKNLL